MLGPAKMYAICNRCFRAYLTLGKLDSFKNFLYRRRVTGGGHELQVLDKTMYCCVCEEIPSGENPEPMRFYSMTKAELNRTFADVIGELAEGHAKVDDEA